MGEGESYLKCNLSWLQLLGTHLSWQVECTEFVLLNISGREQS